jgi:hypothetical protein
MMHLRTADMAPHRAVEHRRAASANRAHTETGSEFLVS